MRLLLAANSDWFLHNFRTKLIEALIARGDTVAVACPDGPYRPALEATGARWFSVSIDRRGMNPLADLASVRAHRRVLDDFRPDLAHVFTLKSIIAVGLAARARRFRRMAIINSYDGLGYVFHSPAWRARAARPLVRALLTRLNHRPRTATVVLNSEDLDRFAREGIAPPERTHLIPGVGIDLTRFTPREHPPETFTILYASRLIHAKGIGTLVEAAKLLAGRGYIFRLRIAGMSDPGNPDTVNAAELEAWRALPFVDLLGHRSDIPNLIAASSVVVLVSRYAEGLPTILAEAGASGVPVITSAQGGCAEIVTDGVNGLVVPTDDADALLTALERLSLDPALADKLGQSGRQIVERRFASDAIISAQFALYDSGVHSPW